jgi:cytoskeletal protein CcmA (bactofilin family)
MAFFGKSKSNEVEIASFPGAIAPSGAGGRGDGGHREARHAVIGPQIRIQGELSGDEDILVEGKVEGKISITKTVRIGPGAQVNADIKGAAIIVAGKVVGNLTAERVEIVSSGVLEGNIRSPRVSIAEGAQFRGSVDMGGNKNAKSDTPKGSGGTAEGSSTAAKLA